MAIYHLEAKVVSRGTGRSAVAASAYLSCSKILNDYDGVQHDYTRKKGLVWQEIFLPEFAPSEWKERGVLWNAVEENEKTKDSRLAREFVVALPIELSEAQWEKLLSDFISGTFVADGMCVIGKEMTVQRIVHHHNCFHNSVSSQFFIPDDTIPCTKYFCAQAYTITIGITVIMVAAIR